MELEQVVKTSLSSKLDGVGLSKIVVSALRSVGGSALYDGRYDFDKSIKVIRRTNMGDQLINGVLLERNRIDLEMPSEIKKAKIMIAKLDLKPIKESWLKENSKYQEIMIMENDRISKSKEIVDAMVETGANTFLLASPEIDQVIQDLLVARKVVAVRISTDEIDSLSRFTGTKLIRTIEDLKIPDILGEADRIYDDEDKGVFYIENASGRKMVTLVVSGATKETSLERWRASIDGINAAEAALNSGVVAGGGAAELHVIEKVKNLRLKGLEQVGLDVVISALECIMRQILTNAGFNGLEKVMAAKASKGYWN